MAKTVDITKYFNRENEENGIWKELVINGEKTGIEACVYGINSNRVYIANEKFKRDEAELEKMEAQFLLVLFLHQAYQKLPNISHF